MVPIDELRKGKPSVLRRVLLVLTPAVAFVAVLALGLEKSTPSSIDTGSPAPEFELPKLDGGSLSSRELKGHPVVLNFWASWCIPCREEAPVLERTWRAYRDQGVIFVGVNIRDAESSAKEFVDEFNITYPVVRDVNLELERELGLTGLPETYFIDEEWRFVSNISGAGQGQQQGTVILGAISEEQLVTNVEILIRRADDSGADK